MIFENEGPIIEAETDGAVRVSDSPLKALLFAVTLSSYQVVRADAATENDSHGTVLIGTVRVGKKSARE